ncbi:UNKNOWN [Stylonychia lemnae]|uniref:Uncharacterized protein n=1 Tax=Stylonychia lemnae TaxID=5949 RepID=A0A077ZW65_STYLE|nr:UNKNOWN [Stylonychia lemnae]|eukprot:CDW73510.1 UNKNOWN [Stylonychia lemnae]
MNKVFSVVKFTDSNKRLSNVSKHLQPDDSPNRRNSYGLLNISQSTAQQQVSSHNQGSPAPQQQDQKNQGQVYAKLKKTFGLPNQIFGIENRDERDLKILEFMEKKIRDDLSQLDQTQREHQTNIDRFNKNIGELGDRQSQERTKDIIQLQTKHKALEKKLKTFLLEEKLNDFKDGTNVTVTQEQIDQLNKSRMKRQIVMQEYLMEMTGFRMDRLRQLGITEQNQDNTMASAQSKAAVVQSVSKSQYLKSLEKSQFKQLNDSVPAGRRQHLQNQRLKGQKNWNKKAKSAKSLSMKKSSFALDVGQKIRDMLQNDDDKKEWNPELENQYREYRKIAKKRMNEMPGARRDKYDDVTTLAVRKGNKAWEKLDSERQYELEYKQSSNNFNDVNTTEDKKLKRFNYDQVRKIIMRSDFVKQSTDKVELDKKLRELSKDEIDSIENEIAEKIIDKYQGLQKQKTYLGELNEAYHIQESQKLLIKPKKILKAQEKVQKMQKSLQDSQKTVIRVNNFLKYQMENTMIPQDLHNRLMVKSRSSIDFRKEALKKFRLQQKLQRSRNFEADAETIKDNNNTDNLSKTITSALGSSIGNNLSSSRLISKSNSIVNVDHKQQFLKNMQSGIPSKQELNYFAPKLIRPLSQSTLLTGGPPRIINAKNLESYVRWIDAQDLKKLIRAAAKIQSAFRTFVIKRKYFYALNSDKANINKTKRVVLQELTQKVEQIKELEREKNRASGFDQNQSSSRDKRIRHIKRGDFSCLKSENKIINESKMLTVKLKRSKSSISIMSSKTSNQKAHNEKALFYAVYNQDIGLLRYLLTDQSYDVMSMDQQGCTILHSAIKLNKKQIALCILQDGCKNDPAKQKQLMCVRDRYGNLAFDYLDKDYEVLLLLEMKGICVHQVNVNEMASEMDYFNDKQAKQDNGVCKIVKKIKCMRDIPTYVNSNLYFL